MFRLLTMREPVDFSDIGIYDADDCRRLCQCVRSIQAHLSYKGLTVITPSSPAARECDVPPLTMSPSSTGSCFSSSSSSYMPPTPTTPHMMNEQEHQLILRAIDAFDRYALPSLLDNSAWTTPPPTPSFSQPGRQSFLSTLSESTIIAELEEEGAAVTAERQQLQQTQVQQARQRSQQQSAPSPLAEEQHPQEPHHDRSSPPPPYSNSTLPPPVWPRDGKPGMVVPRPPRIRPQQQQQQHQQQQRHRGSSSGPTSSWVAIKKNRHMSLPSYLINRVSVISSSTPNHSNISPEDDPSAQDDNDSVDSVDPRRHSLLLPQRRPPCTRTRTRDFPTTSATATTTTPPRAGPSGARHASQRRSLIVLSSNPPDYLDTALMKRWEKCRSCIIPREEEGREELPAYQCTVYKMGHVYIKREMDAPNTRSRWRSWRYGALTGKIYSKITTLG